MLTANLFARWVSRSSPERLEKLMRGRRRRLLLRQIFRSMPRAFRRGEAEGIEAVVEWRVAGRPDGDSDRYQLLIRDQRCRVARPPVEDPTVMIECDPLPFLHLVSGIASGPELFMQGRIKVRGDVLLAARLASLFQIPSSR